MVNMKDNILSIAFFTLATNGNNFSSFAFFPFITFNVVTVCDKHLAAS